MASGGGATELYVMWRKTIEEAPFFAVSDTCLACISSIR